MLPHGIPDGPWQEITTDYFTHFGKDYLLIADPFNKYPYIFKVHSKTLTVLPVTYKTFSPSMALLDASTLTKDLHSLQNLSPTFSHLLALTT